MKIGIIGCGKISNAYLECAPLFPGLEIVHCADLIPGRAEAQALAFGIPAAGPVAGLLADPGVELVINLTIPAAHTEINRLILNAGKHVFCEKPFALNRTDGAELLELARAKNLRLGSAPDTFLGEAHQACRKLIDGGAIGEVIAATAFMACHGPERWHPAPEFFYQPGGGPMFDMGPYYLTALVNLLGPMTRVSAMVKTGFKERIAPSGPAAGMRIAVTTPTHLTGSIEFATGAVATVIMSFDIWAHHLPMLQIHGAEGSLSVPDPNTTFGTPMLYKPGTNTWEDVPCPHPSIYGEKYGRGAGVAEMAEAIRAGRPHRADGALALHVVDAMQAFAEASAQGRTVELATRCERPEPGLSTH
jgi:predicted dehydrogenase